MRGNELHRFTFADVRLHELEVFRLGAPDRELREPRFGNALYGQDGLRVGDEQHFGCNDIFALCQIGDLDARKAEGALVFVAQFVAAFKAEFAIHVHLRGRTVFLRELQHRPDKLGIDRAGKDDMSFGVVHLPHRPR